MMSNEMRYEYLEGLMPVGADPPHHRTPVQDVRRRLPTQGHAFLYGGDGVGGHIESRCDNPGHLSPQTS